MISGVASAPDESDVECPVGRAQACAEVPTMPVTGHAHAKDGPTSENIASKANNTNCGRRHLAIGSKKADLFCGH